MGQLYESMGQLEKAVASYRRYIYVYKYLTLSVLFIQYRSEPSEH